MSEPVDLMKLVSEADDSAEVNVQPVSNLLGKNPKDMTDAELEEYASTLRSMRMASVAAAASKPKKRKAGEVGESDASAKSKASKLVDGLDL